MKIKLFLLCILSIYLSLSCTQADIYLHNPRGSNNRLDETGRNRINANRLFDSQNNDRGGYNVGSLYYYAKSKLSIEWTNQHSCNSANSHCEIILQYMCDDRLRDGASTRTIPVNQAQCSDSDCDYDRQYGMHEDYHSYLKCLKTERNKGLFIADQKLKGQRAIHTRQNPGGTRRGYECPEERDYFPYWRSSQWKDIAVMTNDPKRCEYYERESQNVKSRWECVLPLDVMKSGQSGRLSLPITQVACEKYCFPPGKKDCIQAKWTELPAHGLPPPDCRETEFTRDNHLGNGVDGVPNVYNWTLPDIEAEFCALRIRYNVSTDDYDPWNTDAKENSDIKLFEKFGFSSEEAAIERGYVFKNNPNVKLFYDPELDFELQLAVNTAQFGRVFQDRSHMFQIRRSPEKFQDGVIHNLNVRGKRGNIVQVYPAVEYDFVPNTLEVGIGDFVHIQWTGSNTNPQNNDGQGRAGTDRNNIVILNSQIFPEGSGIQYGPGMKYGHFGTNYPMHLSNASFFGLSKTDLEHLAFLSNGQFGGEMSELDDAGTYFDLTPKKVTEKGTYHYMSTRNNNFSNRDHKGRLLVYDYLVTTVAIGWNGGSFSLADGSISGLVGTGVFDRLHKIRLESWTRDKGEEEIKKQGRHLSVGDYYSSDFVVVRPAGKLAAEGKSFTMEMSVDNCNCHTAIYRSNPENFASWVLVESTIQDGKARFLADSGGVYIARSHRNVGLYVGIAVVGCLVILLVVGAVVYFKKHPKRLQQVRKSVKYAERSTQSKV